MLVKDNKYIPQEDKDFFILLRIGLWQKVEEPLSDSPDWPYIYRLSCEQTVQGIVSDGIAIYRSQYPQTQIPQDINDQFLSATAQIVRRNYTINQKQAEVTKLLNDAHIQHYVVKGQEAAKIYPKPMLRCSGDIDLFVQLCDYQRAQAVLAEAADTTDHENKELIDTSYFFNAGSSEPIEVELHATLHPNLGKRIDSVLDQLQADLFKGSETIDTYSCVYELLHCLQHFHWSGLGIRQIVDWCLLLATSKDVDYNRVQQAIAEMDIQQECNAFYQFCIDWLGLEAPLKLSNSLNSFDRSLAIWREIRESGNMGHHKAPKDRISNTLLRVTSAWNNIFRTYFKHRTISPVVSRRLLGVKFNVYWKQI